jgi:hypothetical protein
MHEQIERERLFGPRLRRGVLTVHILTSVAWIGVDLCMLVLAIMGATSSDTTTQRSAFVTLGAVADALLIPLPLLAVLTGITIALGTRWKLLGTRWKLLRHYWVAVSLPATTASAAAVLFALRPRLHQAANLARDAREPAAAVGPLQQEIIVASSFALLVLCTVTAINVSKPWGRTRCGSTGWYARRRSRKCRSVSDDPSPG